MNSTSSPFEWVGIGGALESTLNCAPSKIDPLPSLLQLLSRPYSSHTKLPSTLGLSSAARPLVESRVSTGATRVASLPLLGISAQCSETEAAVSAQIGNNPWNNAASANAVDGNLLLTIRDAGWTLGVLGPSIRELGVGTGGSVNLHCHPATQKIVAVKTLHARESTETAPLQHSRTALRARLSHCVLMEMAIAVNARHQNVIRTLEAIAETDLRCYLIQEACAVDLFSLVQGQALSNGGAGMTEADVSGYFKQLVEGVVYLHSVGIAHRDLKLDNVCVTEKGVLKIVDFGCATLFRRRLWQHVPTGKAVIRSGLDKHKGAPEPRARAAPYTVPAKSAAQPHCWYVETLSTSVCGSDPYMAPELFSGGRYAAAKVDVWALGVMYFAMKFVQFPWAIARASHDASFRKFAQCPDDFFAKWFPTPEDALTAKSSSSQTDYWTVCLDKLPSAPRARLSDLALMRRILDVNPVTRADIHAIASDSWFLAIGAYSQE